MIYRHRQRLELRQKYSRDDINKYMYQELAQQFNKEINNVEHVTSTLKLSSKVVRFESKKLLNRFNGSLCHNYFKSPNSFSV